MGGDKFVKNKICLPFGCSICSNPKIDETTH